MPVGSPRFSPSQSWITLRDHLRGFGFTESKFRDLLGLAPSVLPISERAIAPLRSLRLAEDSFLELLIRLFVIGAPVRWSALAVGFSAQDLNVLIESGLIRRLGDDACADFYLRPFGDFFVVADHRDHDNEPDYVISPDVSTIALAAFLKPAEGEPTRRALDLGTGSGALALMATRCFEEVCAADINPRAAQFASFNAALNDVTIHCSVCSAHDVGRLGKFDLITFNLPFLYATPSAKSVAFYSDCGDTLLLDLYRLLPELLTPSGRAVLWHQIPTSPNDAFEGLLERADPQDRVEVVWNGPLSSGIGWEAGRALVRMRRETRARLVRVEPPADHVGHHSLNQSREDIERQLLTLDILAADTARLLAAIPCPYPFTLISRTTVVRDGRLVDAQEVRINDLAVPAQILEVLRICDSRQSVAEICSTTGANREAMDVICELARRGIVFLREAATSNAESGVERVQPT